MSEPSGWSLGAAEGRLGAAPPSLWVGTVPGKPAACWPLSFHHSGTRTRVTWESRPLSPRPTPAPCWAHALEAQESPAFKDLQSVR